MTAKKSGGLWETLKTLIYAVLIALVIRTVAFEPFNIPSGSMIPTLLVGDYLFVSKYSYGYSRHSLPLSLPVIPGRIFSSLPERGDVAVFKLPKDNRTDYIKRIVGLPGDKIQVRRGRLFINGELVPRNKIDPYATPGRFGTTRQIAQYIETLPGGAEHRIIEQSDGDRLDNTGVYTVPPRHVFAMGDNRDDSLDSRVLSEVGFIPIENLVGRAEFIFFSHNSSAYIWEVWKWPGAIRWSRLFQSID
ncbi:MAG: signal peptidase I [Alphaproteobacteria bacterium]|jgi:signal peptidase I